jgi:hypothetical protein
VFEETRGTRRARETLEGFSFLPTTDDHTLKRVLFLFPQSWGVRGAKLLRRHRESLSSIVIRLLKKFKTYFICPIEQKSNYGSDNCII